MLIKVGSKGDDVKKIQKKLGLNEDGSGDNLPQDIKEVDPTQIIFR